ncbi:hypothetical protein EFD56_29120 [Rhizobium phaseoli]|nr:hypothetical protein EFD56_29120 [Rhizobium phaseoli]
MRSAGGADNVATNKRALFFNSALMPVWRMPIILREEFYAGTREGLSCRGLEGEAGALTDHGCTKQRWSVSFEAPASGLRTSG